jgi:hypothetical protein
MTNVIVLKLSTGEEIIGYEEDISAEKISISKARVLVVGGQAPDGRVALQMFPWILSAPDATVDVWRDHIMVRVPEKDLPPDAVKGYMAKTSSIQLAGAASGGLIKGK